MSTIVKAAEAKMEKSLEQLHQELSKIRTGRANPSLLDGIKVSCYGTLTPLTQVASVNTEGAQTLSVSPWDKGLIADIEKAIMTSELGLNPTSAGDVIRIPLPPLSEERRREFVKLAKSAGEQTKVSIRNSRRDGLSLMKEAVKDKTLTEDEERRLQTEMQAATDKFIAEVDKHVVEKEKDLLKI